MATTVILGLINIVGGASSRMGGGAMVFAGILMIFLGPILVRIYCELLIVMFAINDTLTDVKNALQDKAPAEPNE